MCQHCQGCQFQTPYLLEVRRNNTNEYNGLAMHSILGEKNWNTIFPNRNWLLSCIDCLWQWINARSVTVVKWKTNWFIVTSFLTKHHWLSCESTPVSTEQIYSSEMMTIWTSLLDTCASLLRLLPPARLILLSPERPIKRSYSLFKNQFLS